MWQSGILSWSERLPRALTALLLVWLALGAILLAVGRSPSPDDAMFLSVPKNWLNGYGWATSFSDKIPFNPDLTAGPTVLMPAALLMAVFGNTYWIAGMTGVLLNMTLIGLCLWQIRQQWQHSTLMTLVFTALCASVCADDISTLIGYYTASLLFFLAILLAFSQTLPVTTRACLLGLLAALAMHTKPLALPAFLSLALLFLLHEHRRQSRPAQHTFYLLASIALPVAVLHGGWAWWRSHTLASYSAEYLHAWQQYGRDFFLQHGSGIHEWQLAGDKLQHITRTIDRNLYHLETSLKHYRLLNPLLGDAPADEQHWIGIGWTALVAGVTTVAARRAWRNSRVEDWALAALGCTTLLYLGWFLGFAMAMSAGHAYFPVQWSLWLVAFFIARGVLATLPPHTAILTITTLCLLLVFALQPTNRNQLLLFDHDGLPQAGPQLQAQQFITQSTFPFPLAGCGYSGYPRHLEYLLPGSQNFQDCYHLIEDNVTLDDAHYFAANKLDPTTTGSALAHFYRNVGKQDLHYRFTWKAPVNFMLVLSLQSMDNSLRLGPILSACKHRVRYRNADVFMLECRFEDLQKTLDLDFMMSEIAINHRWYRTRIANTTQPE